MGFRPTVSNSRPSTSGPAKLLSAHTMKKHRENVELAVIAQRLVQEAVRRAHAHHRDS